MTAPEIAVLSAAAFCTSALTAVVGAGGGMVLLALMLQSLAPAAAIPVHGVVQLASNLARTWLLRRSLNWPIIWRFVVLMPIGVMLGLWVFQGLPGAVVHLLIGSVLLLSLVSGARRPTARGTLPLWAFFPAGLITGALNMIVGVIGPVLGALMARTDLSKEQIVGTLGVFGIAGNALKLAGFASIGFSFSQYGPLILCMVPAAIAGARLGRSLLRRVDERAFVVMFRGVLILLAVKLMLYDGLARLA